MKIPDQLPIDRFLKNSASLLSTVRGDSNSLQQYLAELIGILPDEFAARLDLIALQSLDQMTQTLEDLSFAFLAASCHVNKAELGKWGSIMAELKLDRVKHALTYGQMPPVDQSSVELF